ncbi:MAG: DNA mismatch repair protein MutS [Bacillota bacterium]
MGKATPMMKQYQEIKKDYEDCLLFFRLGDFYEMFFDDAIHAAKELEIVLTARAGGAAGKIPMCGVPFHAADSYIARLLAKGYKIAVCEQVEDPKLTKGLVKREVVRVITPGTVVESHLLEENNHNYLMAVWGEKEGFGVAYTDISTGEFAATQFEGAGGWERLAEEINRINPVECLLPQHLYEEIFFTLRTDAGSIGIISKIHDEAYIKRSSAEIVTLHFKIASLDGLGVSEMPLAVKACAAILDFLQATQKRSLDYLDKLEVYHCHQYMMIDEVSRRNLEITSTMRRGERKNSLLWVCDACLTSMGARLLKDWLEKPLLKSAAIEQRLDGIGELLQKVPLRQELQKKLKEIYDLERLMGRISYGTAGPKDLVAVKNSLLMLPDIFKIINQLESPIYRLFLQKFDLLEDVADLLERAIEDEPPLSPKDGEVIKSAYHAQIDQLRQLTGGGKQWLLELEAQEKKRTGIKSLKIGYNKVFGYYIEVTNANLELVPENYMRKQTLVNAERYITEELKEWESNFLTAKDQLFTLEYQIFCGIRAEIAQAAKRIRDAAKIIAHLDVLQSLATIAENNNYCRPQVSDENILEIKEGRHPVVEKVIGSENYVPNDTHMCDDNPQMMLITGPNMAGKSTYMRQVALITLLARMGSFVPAASAHIGRIDRIFTRVGAHDDLSGGQSTFMVEMSETSNILRNADQHSLIIIDEIGRGTSTFDGLSIAWAVIEYIISKISGAKTLFATHYHELTALTNDYPSIANYSVTVIERDGHIIFLRKITKGKADKSYGIQVASLAGLPSEVLRRARNILQQLESQEHNNPDILPASDPDWQDDQKEPQYEQLIEEIRDLNPNEMTPLEALTKINEWQKQLVED